jgi:LytS/YehU family sensor histidine kinase
MYEKRDPQQAFQYSKMAISYKDSLHHLGKTASFENLAAFNEQERQYEIYTANTAYRSKVKQYGLIAGSLAVLLIGSIFYRSNKMRMRHEIVQQQHKASELEMQALRAQMNPHFIFNSLNSINMFILENNKLQASEYLSKFSRLVRLILQNSQEALIPLGRELEALELYLELEALRFDNKFEYKIAVDDDVDTTVLKVPPLIIQPYAENAIWHGLMHKKEKGHLRIELYEQDEILLCKVIDDGIGRKKAAELKTKSASTHKSMGMRITADRIAMMQQQKQNGTSISITDLVLSDGSAEGTEVLIKIPLWYD